MAKTGHPNFALKYTSPWRGSEHTWSITSNHSGASFTANSDILAFLQSVHYVIADFLAPATTTYLSGFDYYDGQDSAAVLSAEYANAAAASTAGFTDTYGQAYSGSPSTVCGLETCVILEAPVGQSKTGKPVTMKKFIHAVPGGSAGDQPPLDGSVAQSDAATLGNGQLHGSRVLITASGKQGQWVANGYYGAHQMPRGRRKKTSGSSSALLSALLDAGKAVSTAVSEVG